MPGMTSIWSSIEMVCVCKGFEYDDYLYFHKEIESPSSPLCKAAYNALEIVFDIDFEHFEEQENSKMLNEGWDG